MAKRTLNYVRFHVSRPVSEEGELLAWRVAAEANVIEGGRVDDERVMVVEDLLTDKQKKELKRLADEMARRVAKALNAEV